MNKMMNEAFGIDEKSEVDGITADYGLFKIKMKHAYRTNKAYVKMLEREMEPVRRSMENGLLSAEAGDAILHKVYANTIVIGWSGMKDDDGKDIPYSPQKCIEYFKKYPRFFDSVKKDAENFDLFKVASVEADQKNS
jgi:hypothetical protein